ncbi:Periplasmic [NiFeSe] hydrogenase large subunit [Hartmannibacter diazotrophicus]|uniref:Periplasmic [NiFeSe] hydrogenase large subunit n=1 Tax=Hartmannibacter diazotrophicus TaxID=1482074 RepID=A0A2C9D150_9HYPH|nr:nickel-dependent hydrogenase large subunit [Hartmannibacter diazotrophicus]SON53964.1 Periplasmic [NiFeSe] hydrogenase large subunit [Hartmannibacter diazotrophicus]
MNDAPRRIIAGPFNRVEGDLEIRLDIEDGKVVAAEANSPLFRGFERILEGKDPRDAMTVVPRICGICSISQSVAAARALAAASGVSAPRNGELASAVIHAAENIADHLTHFHVFFMADFARPIYEGRAWHAETVRLFKAERGEAVRSAMRARAELFHIMGLLAGKWPHTLSIQPGGTTRAPDARDRIRLIAIVRRFRQWLEEHLFGDSLETVAALASAGDLEAWQKAGEKGFLGLFLTIADDLGLADLGKGPARFLSFGAYPLDGGHLLGPGAVEDGRRQELDTARIAEDLSHSWMLGETLHPSRGKTVPDEDMASGYSWCKAPRLSGRTMEVGALARQVVDGRPLASDLLTAGRGNVRARVVARLVEIALTTLALEGWIRAMAPGEPFIARMHLPDTAEAEGLTEAARGSLGHWLRIEKGRIGSYQIIAPTTWNFSPRDVRGAPGPVEEALAGAPVLPGEITPVSVQHIVRSFDPCMVCTVH